MQTVVETHAFLIQAAAAGMTEKQRTDFVTHVANNPEIGDVIVGTGGCRKVRVAGRGKGKSGGFRVITFYTGEEVPVFLLVVFGKGEKSDLNAKEKKALAKISKEIAGAYERNRRIEKLRQVP
jgi:hypothetical protein